MNLTLGFLKTIELEFWIFENDEFEVLKFLKFSHPYFQSTLTFKRVGNVLYLVSDSKLHPLQSHAGFGYSEFAQAEIFE